MAITVTRSKLMLVLVMVFTVLVAAVAIGTAVILNQRNVGSDKTNALTNGTSLFDGASAKAAAGWADTSAVCRWKALGSAAACFPAEFDKTACTNLLNGQSSIDTTNPAMCECTGAVTSSVADSNGITWNYVRSGMTLLGSNACKTQSTALCSNHAGIVADGAGTSCNNPYACPSATSETVRVIASCKGINSQAALPAAVKNLNVSLSIKQVACNVVGAAQDLTVNMGSYPNGYSTTQSGNYCVTANAPADLGGGITLESGAPCQVGTNGSNNGTGDNGTHVCTIFYTGCVTTTTPVVTTVPTQTPTAGQVSVAGASACIDGNNRVPNPHWTLNTNYISTTNNFGPTAVDVNKPFVLNLKDVSGNNHVYIPADTTVIDSLNAAGCQQVGASTAADGITYKCTLKANLGGFNFTTTGCGASVPTTTTPVPAPKYKIQTAALCTDAPAALQNISSKYGINYSLRDNAAPAAERLNKTGAYLFDGLDQSSTFYIGTNITQFRSSDFPYTQDPNHPAARLSTTVRFINADGTSRDVANAIKSVTRHSAVSGNPDEVSSEVTIDQSVFPDKNATNTVQLLYTGCSAPAAQYNVNVNAVCTDTNQSLNVHVENSTRTLSGDTNPTANFGPFSSGATGTLLCPDYTLNSSTTLHPESTSLTYSSTSNQLTCRYTGCSIPVTTVVPTTTTPVPATPADVPSIQKTASNGTNSTYNLGDTVTYKLSVNNPTGSDMTGLTITDTPAVSYSNYFDTSTFTDLTTLLGGETAGTLATDNSHVSWTGMKVTANSTRVFKFSIKLKSTLSAATCNLTMNNTGSVTGYSTSISPSTTQITIVIPASQCTTAGLTIVKSVSPAAPDSVAPGGTFAATIKVTNPSTNSASANLKEVTDFLPTGFSYLGGDAITLSTGTAATVTASDGTTTNSTKFTINTTSGVDLAPGDSATITFNVKAPSANQCTVYVNVAQITNPTNGPQARANMSVCNLPNTGILDSTIMMGLVGAGLIGASYMSYKYNILERIKNSIRKK